MYGKLEVICNEPTIVGESPLWDEESNSLFYIDIHGKYIRRLAWENWLAEDIRYDQQIGCIVLREDKRLMAAMEDGIYLLNENGSKECVHFSKKLEGKRFNDGKIGPDGCMYVGTIAADFKGAFYRMNMAGKFVKLFDGVGTSNGLAWSADGRTMFFCDSPKRTMDAFTFEQKTGMLYDRRTICQCPISSGVFDGLTIDVEDKIWVAVWDGGCVLRINPENGIVIDRIDIPVSKVTCCAFAGKNLDYLVITSAAYQTNPSKESLAGSLFRIKLDIPGRREYRYRNIA